MPTSPRGKAARSTSRSRTRTSVKASSAKSSKKAAVATSMEFSEGDAVMAKWPGTNLYFKGKVTFVRDDDKEYDVQFDDGTVYTLKSKEVKKSVPVKAERARSRGRSPGRKADSSQSRSASTSRAGRSTSAGRKTSRSSAAVTAPRPDMTPTRQSARLAARADAVSDDDETHGSKAIPNPSHATKDRRRAGVWAALAGLRFQWVGSLFMMALFPFTLVSLHKLCTKSACHPALPWKTMPRDIKSYWDPQAFMAVAAFTLVLRILSFVPVGGLVKTATGNTVRMNGFFALVTLLAIIPGLVFKKVDLSFVTDKYFYLMTSSLVLTVFVSTVAMLVARFGNGRKSNANAKGNTGNLVVDFFEGREFNPNLLGMDMKLQTFRFSMIGLAMLNVCMVVNAFSKGGSVATANPVVVVASAFQVIYALDAMFFEEYYFFSHDAMNTGYGFSLVNSYNSFPFLPTLITKYLIERNPVLPWYALVAIGVVNALGYIIFRASETQRCEFTKNPHSSSIRHLNTLPTAGGRKLLISGWWGFVRHPNCLGEILIQLSWVLPAVKLAGRTDVLIYYLPVFTTLMLLSRCRQQNLRNRKKYGFAWETYCEKVPSNLIPKVY